MEKYEIVTKSVTGEEIVLKGEGSSCVLLVVEGIQKNDFTKSFCIYCNGVKVGPENFALKAKKFDKWQ